METDVWWRLREIDVALFENCISTCTFDRISRERNERTKRDAKRIYSIYRLYYDLFKIPTYFVTVVQLHYT